MATDTSLASRLKLSQDQREGAIARSIEQEAANLPSDAFVWGALSALALSLGLFNAGKKADAMFVGQLATPILALGLYRKFIRLGETNPLDG